MGNSTIPIGHTKQDIKAREKLIKDFYAQWIVEHPDKKVWNRDLKSYIHIKFISINETYEKAAQNIESTLAVFKLTEILNGAIKTGEQRNKRNVENQKQFEKRIILKYGDVKLTLGLQRTTQEYVQYCVTVPSRPDKNKATTEE